MKNSNVEQKEDLIKQLNEKLQGQAAKREEELTEQCTQLKKELKEAQHDKSNLQEAIKNLEKEKADC